MPAKSRTPARAGTKNSRRHREKDQARKICAIVCEVKNAFGESRPSLVSTPELIGFRSRA
jgi:hypothetical protein